jgi:hypothetical protein
MTQEEMIELARQAGLDPDLWNYTDAFETFAKLVAEHEREACAIICDEVSKDMSIGPLEKYRASWIAQAIRARAKQ